MADISKPEAVILTEIMLTVFRVNGRLLEKGDQLVEPLNLTSARWQVLGAVALAGKPLSAPQIAEAMGMTRQGAQKQLNVLEQFGFFYDLTELGNRTYARAMALEAAWANGLADGLRTQDLKQALNTLNTIYGRLDSPVPKKGSRS